MPNRDKILRVLEQYRGTWGEGVLPYEAFSRDAEQAMVQRFEEFVRAHADCCERTCVPGHLTGSALVVTPDYQKVLLTLHGKLNLWLQLGGHADGDDDLARVAMREAHEESGLECLEFAAYEPLMERVQGVEPLPFDLDVHLIPVHKNDPAHFHYDVCYLIVSTGHKPPVISDESRELRWFNLVEAAQVTRDPRMLRQFAKLGIWGQSRD